MFRVTLPNEEVLIVRFQHQPTQKQRQQYPKRKNWKRGTLCQIWLDAPKDQPRRLLGEGVSKVYEGGYESKWILVSPGFKVKDSVYVKPDNFNREAGRRIALSLALKAAYPKEQREETADENLISDREVRCQVWAEYWRWRLAAQHESEESKTRDLPRLSADDLRLLLQQAQTDRIAVIGPENYNENDPQAVLIDKALAFVGAYDPDEPISAEPVENVSSEAPGV